MALTELKRRRRKIGASAWWGQRIFECPNSEATQHEAALWSSIYPGFSGRSAPEPTDVSQEPRGIDVDTARIVATYQTLDNMAYMERYPPKGVVYVRGGVRSEQAVTDKGGNTIQGIDPDDITGRSVWKLQEGSGLVMRPQVTFIARCVVNSKSIYIDQFADKLGSVNNALMAKFGQYGAGPGELLFTRMEAEPLPYNKSHYRVDYSFRWSGETGKKWNGITKSRRFQKSGITIPVFNNVGDGTDSTRIIYGVRPEDALRTAQTYDETAFWPINNMLD